MKLVDFKKIIGYFNPHGVDGFEVSARRDWKIAIVFFLFILAAMLLVDGYFFWKFSGVLEEGLALEDDKIMTVNQKSLYEVLDKIAETEKKFKEGLPDPSIKDPSL